MMYHYLYDQPGPTGRVGPTGPPGVGGAASEWDIVSSDTILTSSTNKVLVNTPYNLFSGVVLNLPSTTEMNAGDSIRVKTQDCFCELIPSVGDYIVQGELPILHWDYVYNGGNYNSSTYTTASCSSDGNVLVFAARREGIYVGLNGTFSNVTGDTEWNWPQESVKVLTDDDGSTFHVLTSSTTDGTTLYNVAVSGNSLTWNYNGNLTYFETGLRWTGLAGSGNTTVAVSSTGQAFVSTDYCSTWLERTDIPDCAWSGVCVSSLGTVVLVGSEGGVATFNAWSSSSATDMTDSYIPRGTPVTCCMIAVTEGEYYAVGTDDAVFLFTNDYMYGKIQLPITGLRSMCLSSEGGIICAGVNGVCIVNQFFSVQTFDTIGSWNCVLPYNNGSSRYYLAGSNYFFMGSGAVIASEDFQYGNSSPAFIWCEPYADIELVYTGDGTIVPVSSKNALLITQSLGIREQLRGSLRQPKLSLRPPTV